LAGTLNTYLSAELYACLHNTNDIKLLPVGKTFVFQSFGGGVQGIVYFKKFYG